MLISNKEGSRLKKNSKLLLMDVDGTLTDGKIYMGEGGEVCKAFNIKDGCGIHDILIPAGIIPIIITGRKSVIVEKRCKEIGIEEVYQGVKDKRRKLDTLLHKLNANVTDAALSPYNYGNIAYIGDDINDLCCMEPIKEAGGFIGCPADAADKVKAIADFISTQNGGDGAVREFIEWILEE